MMTLMIFGGFVVAGIGLCLIGSSAGERDVPAAVIGGIFVIAGIILLWLPFHLASQ